MGDNKLSYIYFRILENLITLFNELIELISPNIFQFAIK